MDFTEAGGRYKCHECGLYTDKYICFNYDRWKLPYMKSIPSLATPGDEIRQYVCTGCIIDQMVKSVVNKSDCGPLSDPMEPRSRNNHRTMRFVDGEYGEIDLIFTIGNLVHMESQDVANGFRSTITKYTLTQDPGQALTFSAISSRCHRAVTKVSNRPLDHKRIPHLTRQAFTMALEELYEEMRIARESSK